MTTYVLVHGAFGGAHSWRKVKPLLAAAGQEVYTPCLTGLGERSHLSSPSVSLRTHITDIVNTVLYEDLRDIVLLGFSYGAFPVTGSLVSIAPRVRHLVYLDSFVPDDGQCLRAAAKEPIPSPGITLGQDWTLEPGRSGTEDEEDRNWGDARVNPQPSATFYDPVSVPVALEDYDFTRTYIRATKDPRWAPGTPKWLTAERVKESPRWRYREVATSHSVPANRPEELAALLLELSSPAPSE
jgi:pimeloyl-ACP methyl ester carboxylesterase